MADETVEIEIKQTQSGNAIETALQQMQRLREDAAKEFPDTQAKIQQLYKRAAVYEAKGIPGGAADARTEAKGLERDLTRWAKERLDHERAVTLEKKEQAKHGHGGGAMGMARMVGEGMDMAFGSGWVMRAQNAVRAVKMFGLPALAVGATAYAGKKAIDMAYEEHEADESQQNRQREERFKSERRSMLLGTHRGSTGAAVARIDAIDQELAELKNHRPEMEREAKLGIWNPLRWSDKLAGTDFTHKGVSAFGFKMWQSKEARALEDADKTAEQLAEERKQAQAAREKHWKEDGSAELDAERLRSQGNMVGARRKERQAEWWKTYNSKLNELGDEHEKEAREFADLGALNSARQENMMAAGMVNARSGAGDVRRVVALASGEMAAGRHAGGGHGGADGAVAAIREQTAIIQWHHEDAKAHADRNIHFRSDLRGRPL